MVEAGRLGRPRRPRVVVRRRRRGAAPRARRPRAAPPAPRSAAARGGRGRAGAPPPSAGTSAPAAARRVRPTSWRSAAASEQVGAEPRMELAELAADRRDADRVLEQAAGVDVVAVRRGRQRAQPAPGLPASRTAATVARRPACEISAARNSRKPSSSSGSRRIAGRERRRIGVRRCSIERTSSWSRSRKRSTRPSTRTASPSREARVEQLDVVPDAPLDAPGRVDELEREVRQSRSSSAAAACARPRRRLRRRGPRRARRSLLTRRV